MLIKCSSSGGICPNAPWLTMTYTVWPWPEHTHIGLSIAQEASCKTVVTSLDGHLLGLPTLLEADFMRMQHTSCSMYQHEYVRSHTHRKKLLWSELLCSSHVLQIQELHCDQGVASQLRHTVSYAVRTVLISCCLTRTHV